MNGAFFEMLGKGIAQAGQEFGQNYRQYRLDDQQAKQLAALGQAEAAKKAESEKAQRDLMRLFSTHKITPGTLNVPQLGQTFGEYPSLGKRQDLPSRVEFAQQFASRAYLPEVQAAINLLPAVDNSKDEEVSKLLADNPYGPKEEGFDYYVDHVYRTVHPDQWIQMHQRRMQDPTYTLLRRRAQELYQRKLELQEQRLHNRRGTPADVNP